MPATMSLAPSPIVSCTGGASTPTPPPRKQKHFLDALTQRPTSKPPVPPKSEELLQRIATESLRKRITAEDRAAASRLTPKTRPAPMPPTPPTAPPRTTSLSEARVPLLPERQPPAPSRARRFRQLLAVRVAAPLQHAWQATREACRHAMTRLSDALRRRQA